MMKESSSQVSNLTHELENILTIQEMSEQLLTGQKAIEEQASLRYADEKEEEEDLNNKMSLLNRKFIYGDISLHNLHTWINILKVIFILLTIVVVYLMIFGSGK